MSSIFTKIIRGNLPCHKVYEDESHIAFMEISPIREGHVLAVPKKEVDYYFDLSDQELADLMIFCKKVAKAIQKTIPCRKVATMVYGLQVPHAHVHLVPVSGEAGELNFSNARASDPVRLASLAEKISQNI